MQLEQMSCLPQSSGQLQLSSSNPQTPSPHREGHSTHKHLGPQNTGGISGVQIEPGGSHSSPSSTRPLPHTAGALHPTVLMESDPEIVRPLKVFPARLAELSPHAMPVPWVLKNRRRSRSPSPSTSIIWLLTDKVPSGPNPTLIGSTVVASKDWVVRMATGISPLLFGLMLFGKATGLISMTTDSTDSVTPNSVTRPTVSVKSAIGLVAS